MTIHRIRLSKMQKIVNVIALSSGLVSAAVIASGVYVYVNRDAIIDNIKSQAIESVMGSMGGLGGLGGDSLPLGTNDLSPSIPSTSSSLGLPVPGSAF